MSKKLKLMLLAMVLSCQTGQAFAPDQPQLNREGIFIPSEEISEDASVSFPTDI
ncbi:hypothetical protein [Bowmanella pacifica]|uniref:Uncharacterized protein n=1 Tax=Bowmanella pacifica TaxID=502051 RepID=A0A917Z524_9ALTE|nr:hypothetical protein [Bowmanella pacifica]GGO74971.1 hypothetical protein GCM10010982_39050 [Bowmanella pacifica]